MEGALLCTLIFSQPSVDKLKASPIVHFLCFLEELGGKQGKFTDPAIFLQGRSEGGRGGKEGRQECVLHYWVFFIFLLFTVR